MSGVGIVADDLTGANDTAVQFAREGWPTLLSLRPDGRPAPVDGVLAVCTDARALGDEAVDVTAAAVERLRDAGVGRLYLKLDSTLRGSVAGQVEGALRAWSARHPDAVAVVCPAYPAMGRVVADGVVLAGGRRLEDGPAGRDPVTPVRTSLLADLLPGSVHVPLPPGGDPGALADALARAGAAARVLTVDARDDADLARVAGAVTRLGPRVVPAGSAGLALALAPRWYPGSGAPGAGTAPRPVADGPVLVLVTSLHQVAREQEERLRVEWGSAALHLAPATADLRDARSLAAWSAAHVPDGPLPEVVVVTAPLERAEGRGDAGRTVAAALADLVAALHAAHPARAVVVTGGDGARALVDRWGCTGIAVHGAVVEGVPHGLLVGGEADGLPITTKAGGFGEPGTLVRAVAAAAAVRAPSR
ncbi:four-carbon acid sugar kinase family protein [Geodermatophilus maliterrae]|uniref:Four-carbon acid sugar kinase family protein n=1 Tax=Geodermatophilus maliterrae TaxID=3162531 RepID=A0ABV3XED7_9ACTN